MAKSVDAQHLKCCDRKVMRVQVPPPAQIKNSQEWEFLICAGKKANCFAFGRDLKGGAMWVYEQASQGRERYIFREFTTIKIIDSWPSPILGTMWKLSSVSAGKFLHLPRKVHNFHSVQIVRLQGLEPWTVSLRGSCSTNWAKGACLFEWAKCTRFCCLIQEPF